MMKMFGRNAVKSRMKYFVILIAICIFIFHLTTYMSTERFREIDVAHDDISFYGRDSCPFCVKMKKLLNETPDLNKKIQHIDVETPEGNAKFSEVDANGVPHFECKSTGKSTSGYQPIEHLLTNLGLK